MLHPPSRRRRTRPCPCFKSADRASNGEIRCSLAISSIRMAESVVGIERDYSIRSSSFPVSTENTLFCPSSLVFVGGGGGIFVHFQHSLHRFSEYSYLVVDDSCFPYRVYRRYSAALRESHLERSRIWRKAPVLGNWTSSLAPIAEHFPYMPATASARIVR